MLGGQHASKQAGAARGAGRALWRPAQHRLIATCGVAALALLWLLPPLLASAQAPSAPSAGEARVRRDERLTGLFDRLGKSDDQLEGATIVEEIWRVWLDSGRPEIDAMMRDALARLDAADPEGALAILDRIVEWAPDWSEGWNKRATVLYLVDEHDKSLADIDRVLALEPRHFGALAGRGLIQLAREDYRGALDAYRRARAINPFLDGATQIIEALERKVGERPL